MVCRGLLACPTCPFNLTRADKPTRCTGLHAGLWIGG